MVTHSGILAWKIPWMEEHGGLQSMGLQRVGHDWATELIVRFPHFWIWLSSTLQHWISCGHPGDSEWLTWVEEPAQVEPHLFQGALAHSLKSADLLCFFHLLYHIYTWDLSKILSSKDHSNSYYSSWGKNSFLLWCSHEIKRCLLLGRKTMTDLDNILKNADITLLTKVRIVRAMVFPAVMYRCESWIIKTAELQRTDAFQTVVLE